MKRKKMLLAGILSLALAVVSIIPQFAANADDYANYWKKHGTDRSTQITEEMISSTPPDDYRIPDGLVQDAKDGMYSKYFTKDSIQTVNVTMDENNLNYMLQHAGEKKQVMTTSVKIGDAPEVGYVGIKTKGNYTLSGVYSSDSDKFSFTLNFGKYIKKKKYGSTQNFYGVSKICLNNLYFDTTALKEYTALRLMSKMGVPTPEYGVAKLYINGKFYGLCSMIEAMDKSILERSLNLGSKEVSDYLVKPEYTTLQYSGQMDKYMDEGGTFTPDTMKSVLYLDENTGKYVFDDSGFTGSDKANIVNLWENDSDTLSEVAANLPTVFTWQRKLTLLSQGKDFSGNAIDVNSDAYTALLEQVMDVDETLRYFAVQSFLVQTDNMFNDFRDWGTADHQKNFALYVDEAGKSKVLPWDYDLSWGNFRGADSAADMANYPLNNMTYDMGMNLDSFYKNYPLFHVIYQNSRLLDKYHQYMADCAKITALGGVTSDGKTVDAAEFVTAIDGIKDQIIKGMGETLAPNVRYNQTGQPGSAERGIISLRRAVSMRSLGVWLMTGGNFGYKATGYGCNLLRMGNGSQRGGLMSGKIGIINPETGIFVLGDFSMGGNVYLTGGLLKKGDAVFDQAAKRLSGKYSIYGFESAKTADGTYELYMPLPKEKNNLQFYSYDADTDVMTKLAAEADSDGRYRVETKEIACIVVAEGAEVLPAQKIAAVTQKTVITAADQIKSASEKKQSFTLGAKTNYGTMTYTSSEKKVKVSAKGKVTLPAGFSGNVKIAVKVKAGAGYTAAEKTVRIRVPAEAKLKSVKKKTKTRAKVAWKKVPGASGYVISYSTNKKFTKNTTVTVKKAAKVSTVIGGLKKGKTYYVRIRSYILSGKKKYTSLWSSGKKIKI